MPLRETTIYQQHPDWLYFGGLILIAGIALVVTLQAGSVEAVFFVLAVTALLISFARYRRLYTVTDQRLIMEIGLIARNTNEMEIRHIRGINVRQNVIERLFGIGTLEIISAADGGAEVIFGGVRDPLGLKDRIRALRHTP
jgi:uncharacterized membrane protein YdbT with pleckstrin-like domain